MIASHNTFSYLKSSFFNELFSVFWRCQNQNAKQQVVLYNVEVCDIRVNYNGMEWKLCHGKASFGPAFYSLESLISWCMSFGFSKFRLMYERENVGYYQFAEEWVNLPKSLTNKCVCCIYNPDWTYLYGDSSAIMEHNKHMWYKEYSLWKNLKNFLSSTIKSYAKKNNRLYEGSDIHMYDYVQYMKDEGVS